MKKRWMVVRLYRYKRCDELSYHWFRWTARISAFFYQAADVHSTVDVWRTR